MKKYIYILLLSIVTTLPFKGLAETAALPGQWRIHNTLDQYFKETIDTPNRVYLLALGQRQKVNSDSWKQLTGQLFVLDKNSGEMTGYNRSNYLNGNVITDIAYNPAKKYLLIIYDDYGIDILDEDGDKVHYIPGLVSSALNVSKNVNSVTFDAANNRAYLATDFGYIVIDDKKYVISESRIYDKPLNSVCRVGDYLLAATADGLYIADAGARNPSFESFRKVSGSTGEVAYIMPLTDTTFGIKDEAGINLCTIDENGTVAFKNLANSNMDYFSENKNGYFMRRNGAAYQLNRAGELEIVYVNKTGYGSTAFGSWDLKEFYFPADREGVVQMIYTGNYNWQPGSALFSANAPEPYGVFSFDYSPEYGMLAGNGTFNRFFTDQSINYQGLVSGYESGIWDAYGPTVTENALGDYVRESYGPVIDPIDGNLIWLGTRRAGLARFNLNDNSMDLYSHPEHPGKGEPGFHAVFPTSIYWDILCNVSAPSFDSQGNLWCVFNPSHALEGSSPLYCWKAADRKTNNVSAFKEIPVKGYGKHYDNLIVTATKNPYSPNFLIFGPTTRYYEPFYLFYHGGSIDDTSDDRLYSYDKFLDQDGSSVPYTFFNTFYEDPSTGYIWVGTDAGVFYFDPKEALRAGDSGGSLHVRRVKVARNDGTNLADYLLNGYDVTTIASDGAGRKWFGTNGGGIVVTSADGSRIIDQLTADNSLLPSNNVYSLGMDSEGNAVWIGGAKQISTFFCDASPAAENYSDVLAFPNPVRPEYSGPVTIKGLMDNSLVKIVDASGSLIKELGISNGGMTQWDLTDMRGKEVSAGVYYILSSTTGESVSSSGNSTKILVIR